MKKAANLDHRKAELISGLRDVRARILALASSIPESQQDEIDLGFWSCRDMLSNLAGWDETNIRASNEILERTPPSFYGHSGKDWAEYNANLVSEYAREIFQELLSLVRETHQNMLSIIQDISEGEIWADRGIRAKGWKVTIGRLLDVEKEDEEEHYSQLEEFIWECVKS
jgi:hypothetical protein